MVVRAKFVVDEVTSTHNGAEELRTIILSPVTRDTNNAENSEFWKWTPSGKIEMSVLNLKAAEQFELGAEYYVDFTKAEQQ